VQTASEIRISSQNPLFLNLTHRQQVLHNLAVRLCQEHERLEVEIIQTLSQIYKENIFKLLGFESMYLYGMEALGLSDSNSYTFNAVAAKCEEFSELKYAVNDRSLTVSKAARLLTTLSKENAKDLVEYAKVHSKNKIDERVAHLRPRSKVKDKIRILSD
jgi:ribosomal protein L7/L12